MSDESAAPPEVAPAPAKSSRGAKWRTALSVVFTVLVVARGGQTVWRLVMGSPLAACDDSATQSTLNDILKEKSHLEPATFSNVTETHYAQGQRSCTASLAFPDKTTLAISYHLYREKGDTEVMLDGSTPTP